MSVSDWYTIFSELAGVDPTDTQAEKANVWLKEGGFNQMSGLDQLFLWARCHVNGELKHHHVAS